MTCCQTEVELLPAVQPDSFLFLPWSREPYKEVCFRCECIDQHNKLRALFHSAYSHSYNGVLCLRSAQADQVMALFCCTYSHARDSALCLRIAQADQLMALLSCIYSHADGSVLCLRSVRADAVMALFRCTYSHAYGRVLCLRFVRPDQLMALFHCMYSVPTIECSVSKGGGGGLITQWPFFTVHTHMATTELCLRGLIS